MVSLCPWVVWDKYCSTSLWNSWGDKWIPLRKQNKTNKKRRGRGEEKWEAELQNYKTMSRMRSLIQILLRFPNKKFLWLFTDFSSHLNQPSLFMFGFLLANERKHNTLPYNGRSSRQVLISMIFRCIPLTTLRVAEEGVMHSTSLWSSLITFGGAEIQFLKLNSYWE